MVAQEKDQAKETDQGYLMEEFKVDDPRSRGVPKFQIIKVHSKLRKGCGTSFMNTVTSMRTQSLFGVNKNGLSHLVYFTVNRLLYLLYHYFSLLYYSR